MRKQLKTNFKKMKYIILTTGTGIFILLMSCNQSSKSPDIAAKPGIKSDSAISYRHNSSNSLDVEGLYKGTLPCADCEGIETEIVLDKDMSFVKRTVYLGKDGKVFEEKGLYSWNTEGNIIILAGIKNAPNQYFAGENKLIQLDMAGNRITGNLAGNYILYK